jgi:hypothetical protein
VTEINRQRKKDGRKNDNIKYENERNKEGRKEKEKYIQTERKVE